MFRMIDLKTFFLIMAEIVISAASAFGATVRERGVVTDCDFPVQERSCGEGSTSYDFGRDAFGWLEINVPESVSGAYEVHLGERLLPNGRVDLSPGGTIRAACVTGTVDRPGWIRVPIQADVRNTQGVSELTACQLVRLPPDVGVVMPFRYVEIVKSPFDVSRKDVRRTWLHWSIDETASSFSCSSTDLCRVYDFCKYSVVATSFSGLYVDGDRERIPYEADA